MFLGGDHPYFIQNKCFYFHKKEKHRVIQADTVWHSKIDLKMKAQNCLALRFASQSAPWIGSGIWHTMRGGLWADGGRVRGDRHLRLSHVDHEEGSFLVSCCQVGVLPAQKLLLGFPEAGTLSQTLLGWECHP